MTATVHIAGESLLQSTALIDSDHPAMLDFSLRHAHGATAPDRAVSLYLAVREVDRYDPYGIAPLHRVPRVGYADVRIHLITERMRALLGTDLFI